MRRFDPRPTVQFAFHRCGPLPTLLPMLHDVPNLFWVTQDVVGEVKQRGIGPQRDRRLFYRLIH